MIARIFRVRIRPELRAAFEKDFFEISIPLVKSRHGLISVTIGRPTKWIPDEYVMVSTWQNEKSLEGFAGKNWNVPAIPDDMEKYVSECWVHHYEIFG